MPDDATRPQPPQEADHTRTQPPQDGQATRPQSDNERSKSSEKSAAKPLFDDYALHETLGEGAMGAVYKATQIKLNRTVALKVIHGGAAAGAKERIRFLAEA